MFHLQYRENPKIGNYALARASASPCEYVLFNIGANRTTIVPYALARAQAHRVFPVYALARASALGQDHKNYYNV